MCLRSHVPMGFQVGSEDLLNIAVTLKFQLYKHSDLLRGIITPSQKKAVAAFVQAPGDYFDAEPTFKQSYAPQSGEIFGILKQMKETFETNLSRRGLALAVAIQLAGRYDSSNMLVGQTWVSKFAVPLYLSVLQ